MRGVGSGVYLVVDFDITARLSVRFDWIFSSSLKGLVTKYGGANSHMAIRCAEFGIPAAIGCGEQIFDRILRGRAVEINCSEGRIVPIEG